MSIQPVQREAQFAEFQDIVPDLVPLAEGIGHTPGAGKAVNATEARQAQALSPGAAILFVDVAFFAAEPPGQGVESQPALPAGAEHAQTLGEDRKGFPVGVLATGISPPDTPHFGPPDIGEMRPELIAIIGQKYPLDEVIAGMMALQVFPQSLETP